MHRAFLLALIVVYQQMRWVFICLASYGPGQMTVLLVLQQRLQLWTW